jgi:hypothetical protein
MSFLYIIKACLEERGRGKGGITKKLIFQPEIIDTFNAVLTLKFQARISRDHLKIFLHHTISSGL